MQRVGAIHLWDPLTGQELLSLPGHKAQVNGLAFAPDAHPRLIQPRRRGQDLEDEIDPGWYFYKKQMN